LVASGNLVVSIYDDPAAGNLIYSETFTNAISNGTWSVMLGEGTALPLEFGKAYWRDYSINGEDVDFTLYNGTSVERRLFYSPLGDISGEDVNQSSNFIIKSLNTSATSFMGNVSFNGGWEAGGITIQGGKIYADTGFFYNLSKLNVSTININSSLIPSGDFDNTFDLGSSTLRWRDLWLGRNANVSDTLTAKTIKAYDWTNVTIDFTKIQNVPAFIASTNVAFTNQTNIFTLNQNFSNNITFTTASARLCNATGTCYTLEELNTTSGTSGNYFNQQLNITSNATLFNFNVTNMINFNGSISGVPVGVASNGSVFYNNSMQSLMVYNGTSWLGLTGVPQGTIAAFNSVCPSGWTEFTSAQGRYIVGNPSGGTLAATVGTALTNSENRATGSHTHPIQDTAGNSLGTSGAGGTATLEFTQDSTGDGLLWSAVAPASPNNIAGTNAPYVQYLVCIKD